MITAAFYIGVLLFISYLIFILVRIGIKRLPSLSHSYYEIEITHELNEAMLEIALKHMV